MPVLYVNNFNSPWEKEIPGPSPIPEYEVIGFASSLDLIEVGRLNVTANGGATAAFHYPTPKLGDADPLGTIVTVTAPAPTTAHPEVSESFYGTMQGAFLRTYEKYTAELSFDLPNAEVGADGIHPTWSVELNFKTGDFSDNVADVRAGASCQFSGSGAVKFNSTSFNERAQPHNYLDFTAPGGGDPTLFTITVEMQDTSSGLVQGTGALSYGETVVPPHPLTPTGAVFTNMVRLGLALRTTTGGTYSVRLRSLTLSAALPQL